MFLTNINQVRSIEWSRQHLWDIRFADIKGRDLSPFDKWLPAIRVDDISSSIQTKSIQATLTSFNIPIGSKAKSISITFIDDIDLTLFHWFRFWMNNDIMNNGEGLSTIEEIQRRIDMVQLNNDLEAIYTVSYYVFPQGDLKFSGLSESGNFQFTVDLVKLEIVSEKYEKGSTFTIKSIATQVLNKITGGIRYTDI